jgi:ammonium transporter, Amt family
VICIGYSALVTYGLYKVVDALLGMRVESDEERIGLDLTQHREVAYTNFD